MTKGNIVRHTDVRCKVTQCKHNKETYCQADEIWIADSEDYGEFHPTCTEAKVLWK